VAGKPASEALRQRVVERVPLYHPRGDTWESHFAWSNDFTLVIGLTPTG
jgi:hypothetical protein